ncbi:hypothetical protein LTSEADE_3061 [Salmonella enterica subsp. enterica serovar Adelaide str. A4-669]|uniref:Uncharacterized protein n=1 Tax=Salmonella enterica subsp. enterica serovar Adelaide str. A4-669 TaxID=913063 RepID=A0A6C8GKY0_SALET|nr:hypothetical protein LTSEADE_3061 [Salmonella enterica subsp. enterica serovar Adelaide str. A4-669]
MPNTLRNVPLIPVVSASALCVSQRAVRNRQCASLILPRQCDFR